MKMRAIPVVRRVWALLLWLLLWLLPSNNVVVAAAWIGSQTNNNNIYNTGFNNNIHRYWRMSSCSRSNSSSSRCPNPIRFLAASNDDDNTNNYSVQQHQPPKSLPQRKNPKQQQHTQPRREVLIRKLPMMIMGGGLSSVWTIASTSPAAHAAPPIAIMAEELGYFPVTVTIPTNTNTPTNNNSMTKNKATTSATTDTTTKTVYVPARVRRHSTAQAVALATFLRTKTDARMAGTYWCPHCRRQKELFGREAWAVLTAVAVAPVAAGSAAPTSATPSSSSAYLECAPLGYQARPELCALEYQIEAYPTWILPTQKNGSTTAIPSPTPSFVLLAGERSLAALAQAVGYPEPWDVKLEATSNPPPPLGGGGSPQEACGGGGG